MKTTAWLLLGLLMLWGPLGSLQAQEQDKEKEKAESAQQEEAKELSAFDKIKEEHAKLTNEFREFQQSFMKEYQEIKDEKEKQTKAAEFMKMRAENEAALLPLGEKAIALLNDESSDAQPKDVITWVMRNIRNLEVQDKIAGILVDKFLNSDEALPLVSMLAAGGPTAPRIDALKKFAAEGKTDEIKATAALLLADSIGIARQFVSQAGASEFVKKHAEKTDEELIAHYKEISDKYGDLTFGNTTIGKYAGKKIKAIEVVAKLKIGLVAPDIEGPDIDGETFKLSDYRGKVVMLDFWGDW
jgi:hypothetical protein